MNQCKCKKNPVILIIAETVKRNIVLPKKFCPEHTAPYRSADTAIRIIHQPAHHKCLQILRIRYVIARNIFGRPLCACFALISTMCAFCVPVLADQAIIVSTNIICRRLYKICLSGCNILIKHQQHIRLYKIILIHKADILAPRLRKPGVAGICDATVWLGNSLYTVVFFAKLCKQLPT